MKLKRFRRLKYSENLRDLVCENRLDIKDFIYPLFIIDGDNKKFAINNMPNIYQMSIDNILKECDAIKELGIKNVLLFAVPPLKDSLGSDALDENGLLFRAIKEIKKEHNDIMVCTDLCFCEYTSHGHCGFIDNKSKIVDNDKTLKLLLKQALLHVKSGSDLIAPSGMMDLTISYLRDGLDKEGFYDTPIMSYSTKFASSYYGPFRDAVNSAPSFGNRDTYQMSFANSKEAVAQSIEDDIEGADILMVKPALAYLDIVKSISENTLLPLAVYNTSAEYAMLKLSSQAGILDYEKALMENMVAFKRAGAKIIISYHTKDVAVLLKEMRSL